MRKKQKKDNLLTFRKGSCSLIVCVHLIIYKEQYSSMKMTRNDLDPK